MLRVVAHQGSSNKHQYTVQKNGESFDLNAAGVTRIEVVEQGQVLSSDDDTVTFSGSNITIEWGSLGVSGRTNPTIYAYKASDTKGEVIVGPGMTESISLEMMADERPA